MTFKSINPANNQMLQEFESLSQPLLRERIAVAAETFRQWRDTEFAARQRVLMKFAATLRARRDELAALITLEMGKRIAESRREVIYCAEIAEFYATGAVEFLADQTLSVPGVRAKLQFPPLGVLLGIMPWNFPFYQVVRFAAPNLMAGNVVLVKHAHNVPQCALKIAELFQECGLPTGAFTNLFIPVELVETAIADPAVQGVSLTGSERAGSAVAALAGKHLKRSVLELGGNDPFIVLEDAAVAKAARMGVRARTVNAGQSCVAAKRFIVVESVADEFLEVFGSGMANLKLGDPADESTTLGPLSTEAAAADLLERVNSSIQAGAEVILGGDRPSQPGAWFNATILAGVTEAMPTFDTELFGPVATVYVVPDEPAAIALANNSSYGLGGSVFTQDLARGQRVAQQIESGMVFLNKPTTSQAELPFGGIKNSGYGRELSELGILEFVNKKLVYLGSEQD